MRRRGPIDLTVDPLIKPDIRTLFIMFILQFVQPSTSHAVKVAFLESQRETLSALFKRIAEDPFSLMRLVLETCWSGIWKDQKLKRTTKIALFNEQTLNQVQNTPMLPSKKLTLFFPACKTVYTFKCRDLRSRKYSCGSYTPFFTSTMYPPWYRDLLQGPRLVSLERGGKHKLRR